MDCEITICHLYNKECFFKTVLVKKPDSKTGCSYFRKMKRKNLTDETEEEEIKTSLTGKKEKPKKKKKNKKENNLSELMK